jgi:hypothetical protein
MSITVGLRHVAGTSSRKFGKGTPRKTGISYEMKGVRVKTKGETGENRPKEKS